MRPSNQQSSPPQRRAFIPVVRVDGASTVLEQQPSHCEGVRRGGSGRQHEGRRSHAAPCGRVSASSEEETYELDTNTSTTGCSHHMDS